MRAFIISLIVGTIANLAFGQGADGVTNTTAKIQVSTNAAFPGVTNTQAVVVSKGVLPVAGTNNPSKQLRGLRGPTSVKPVYTNSSTFDIHSHRTVKRNMDGSFK